MALAREFCRWLLTKMHCSLFKVSPTLNVSVFYIGYVTNVLNVEMLMKYLGCVKMVEILI